MSGSLGLLRTIVLAILLEVSAVAAAEPRLISLDVTSASTIHVRGRLALVLTLSPESKRAFAAYSSEYVGRFVEFRMLDQAPLKIRILESIIGGTIHLPGGQDEAAALELAHRLSGARIDVRVLD